MLDYDSKEKKNEERKKKTRKGKKIEEEDEKSHEKADKDLKKKGEDLEIDELVNGKPEGIEAEMEGLKENDVEKINKELKNHKNIRKI